MGKSEGCRFEDVLLILQARYGKRLAELRPTDASLPWLYGDRLSARDTVERLNFEVRMGRA